MIIKRQISNTLNSQKIFTTFKREEDQLLYSAVAENTLDLAELCINIGGDPQARDTFSNETILGLAIQQKVSANFLKHDDSISGISSPNVPAKELQVTDGSEYEMIWLLLSYMTEKEVNQFLDAHPFYERIINKFINDMNFIWTMQLSAFGISERKNLDDIKTDAQEENKSDNAVVPLLDVVLALIMSESSLYPKWYAHRAKTDIDKLLPVLQKYKAEAAERINSENKTLCFSFDSKCKKRKADENFGDFEAEPLIINKTNLEAECNTEENFTYSKKTTSRRK